MGSKIRIAFIKFGGLSAGGTEKFLQNIAANLNRDKFIVDYYYCDSAPYIGSDYKHADTNEDRLKCMTEKNVNLIKFHVGFKNVNTYTHNWINTDFWEKFNESNYDIIQTGRGGLPEYPFCLIRKTPIIDSIHLTVGADNQKNISRVMHICQWNAQKWINKGGDKSRIVIVSHPIEINFQGGDLREEYNLNNKFIFGFHQRNDDDIFSDFPLNAYKKIENDETFFILLGGGSKYKTQAKNLDIKNILFLDHTGDPQIIYKFLNTLNVYSHGRKDGEVNSTAMAEAMYFGLPIVSHTSNYSNGHIECIGESGRVVSNIEDYIKELLLLKNDKKYYNHRQQEAYKRFIEKYELKKQINLIEEIYENVVKNPFPNKTRRILYGLVNTLKIKIFSIIIIPYKIIKSKIR